MRSSLFEKWFIEVSWRDKKKTGRDRKPNINSITRDFQNVCHYGTDYGTFPNTYKPVINGSLYKVRYYFTDLNQLLLSCFSDLIFPVFSVKKPSIYAREILKGHKAALHTPATRDEEEN